MVGNNIATNVGEEEKMNTEANSKSQATNSKQYQSSNDQKPKSYYNLEIRTLQYAKTVNDYVKKLPKTIPNIENGRQLVKAAGSIGANYIEANESLSKKDFSLRIKISRKEAKESRYWLYLTEPNHSDSHEKQRLIEEATELTKIFSSILLKCKMFKT